MTAAARVSEHSGVGLADLTLPENFNGERHSWDTVHQISRVSLEDRGSHRIRNRSHDLGAPRDRVIVLDATHADTVELYAVAHQALCVLHTSLPVEVGIDRAADGVPYVVHSCLHRCVADDAPSRIRSRLFNKA